MRLILENAGGQGATPSVSTGLRATLAVDLPSTRPDRARLVDVLDRRPDGTTWLLGTLMSSGSTAARTVEVPLNPFAVAGLHELTVELDGLRLPGALSVSVVSGEEGKRPAARRYLGRGRPPTDPGSV